MNWLIVTDLDGTLLDDGYPSVHAGAAIDTIAASYDDAWIALASSKTPAEMMELVGHCRTEPILIFENGSGMAWREAVLCRPGGSRLGDYELECFGRPYADVLGTLQALRRASGYPFRGFYDMTVDEVAQRTGLAPAEAQRARERVGSEPIVWEGSEAALDAFRADLAEQGLNMVLGGRFHHIGSHLSKGRALAKLWRMLRFQFGVHAQTVACGDAPNDLEMMERADHAIVFPTREGGYLHPENPNTYRAPIAGPAAWLEAVSGVLDHHDQGAVLS
ncbi:MAG: HAD-IIB family hydrolase [Pseudomonadales bacterium]|jgi:mannosyl-3-phosphoglycerate phosphatase